jgi:hypothetical protein
LTVVDHGVAVARARASWIAHAPHDLLDRPALGRVASSWILGRALLVLALATAVLVWLEFTLIGGSPVDARSYYQADLGDLYWEGSYPFRYSPAVAEAFVPFQALSFPVFVAILRAAELGATALITGPFLPLVIFWSPLASEINAANINMLIVAVAIFGLRWPALWSFVLLTKVTPGIGLLWFAVRKEWHSLAVVSAVTLGIASVSFAIDPELWYEWIAFLTVMTPGDGVPLWIRVAAAAVIVIWGAWTDRPWTVVVAAALAMPRLYLMTPAMLVGLLYYLRPGTWRPPTRSQLAESRRVAASGPAGAPTSP